MFLQASKQAARRRSPATKPALHSILRALRRANGTHLLHLKAVSLVRRLPEVKRNVRRRHAGGGAGFGGFGGG